MRIIFFMLLLANLAVLAGFEWIDVPASAPRGDTHLPPLVLAGLGAAAPKVADSVEALRTHVSPATQCVSVGPFDDEASASRAADILRNRRFSSRPRSEAGHGTQGFWVHVEGITSDAVATMDLHKLADIGITDASVLQPSKDERRISAGLFTARDQANRRLQEVRKLGLKGEIAERRLPLTLYWVDVAVKPEDGTLPAQDLYKGLSLKIGARPCPAGSAPPTAIDESTESGQRRSRSAMATRLL